MGGTFGHPVPNYVDTQGYVCMTFRSYDKFRVLHAPKEVISSIKEIVRVLSQDEIETEDKCGSVQFRLPGRPFMPNCDKGSAITGKIFSIRILEEMNAFGYDMIVSSDLSQNYDQSSWFFKKTDKERPRQPVLCLAPAYYDRLFVVRGCDYIINMVRDVLKSVWNFGIQTEKTSEYGIEKIYEFKLKGNPWFGEQEESPMSCNLLLNLIEEMGALHWRLMAASNIKGDISCLFFIFDENYTLNRNNLAVMSFNKHDRIRLLRFNKEIQQVVKTTIIRFHQTKEPEAQDYFGTHEIKVKGYPFYCSGHESISSRQIICRILEDLAQNGWECFTSMNNSRKIDDKSALVFKRCTPNTSKFTCMYMADMNKLYFINFPNQVSKLLRNWVEKYYLPGILNDKSIDAACYEMNLTGDPWTENSSYNLHARSLLTCILKECFNNGWHIVASADVSSKYVRHQNGMDHPLDVHSWFFSFQGIPQDLPSKPTTPISYVELKVSDLEVDNNILPPMFEKRSQNSTPNKT